MSGREAKLILRLATGEGHIVSRADIAQAMGYQDISPETRSLDAVLRRLRLKVRETGMELPVHVVHAVGFHFSGTIIIS